MTYNSGFGDHLDVSERIQVDMPTDDLLPRFRRWLYYMAYAYSGDMSQVDDLAQEGYIAMWRARAKFEPDLMDDSAAALVTYLTTAAKMRMKHLLTKGRPFGHEPRRGVTDATDHPVASLERMAEEAPHEFDATELLTAADLLDGIDLAYHRGEIAAAIDELSPQQRRYVLLRFWGGMTTTEIAAVLDVSVGRAQQLWSGTSSQRGAKASLRASLGHLVGV